jgi:hypothetical protein
MDDKKQFHLPPGSWAGSGIRLRVEETETRMELLSAEAKIRNGFLVNSAGEFRLEGVFVSERIGLRFESGSRNEKIVIFEGKVKENFMTMKISSESSNNILGEYVLELGKQIKLQKCK